MCIRDRLQIIHLDKGLSQKLLISAYQNAGLYLHPAFYELPGYTYLEAAKIGTPIIASTWGTIQDYFIDPITKEYSLDQRIRYCLPYDINGIEKHILCHFGKRYGLSNHPIFDRNEMDVASEFLQLLK